MPAADGPPVAVTQANLHRADRLPQGYEGRIHFAQWEGQQCTKRYGCEIIADKVDFLTKGRGTSGDSAPDIDED